MPPSEPCNTLSSQCHSPNAPESGLFPPTQWSVVATLHEADASRAMEAMEHLCAAYWQPLFAFLRRRGLERDQAADDIQGFFHHLLTRETLLQLLPGHGRLRSFLLTALNHWRIDQFRRQTGQKRGSGRIPLPLDELTDDGLETPVSTDISPEESFDRGWARTLVRRATDTVRIRYVRLEKGALFDRLSPTLLGLATDPHDRIGLDHGLSRGAVRQTAFEMRKHFVAALRHEVRQTVAHEADVDDELRHLIRLWKE